MSTALTPIPISSPLESVSERIPGLVPTWGHLMIAAETNIGKTLVALEIAHALVTQTPLWGALPVEQGVDKALYVLGEHHHNITLETWAETGLDDQGRIFILGPEHLGDRAVIDNGARNLSVIAKLAKVVREGGYGFVVFDPLASFVRGAGAENDNVTMRATVETLTWIANQGHASCLIQAHAGKPDGDGGRKQTYYVRGASAVEDAATRLFYLKSDTPNAKIHDFLTLEQRKKKAHGETNFRLARTQKPLRHTLLTDKAAWLADQRLRRAERLHRAVDELQTRGMTKDEAVRFVAEVEQSSRATIYRDLGPRANLTQDAA